jgi:general secretion pathway protein G
MRNRVRKAFTLVEILIVVVILGILAAIVIPQFTNASEEAQVGNVQTQLQTIRSQIELFRVRNNGQSPVIDDAAQPFSDLLAGVNNTFGLPDGNSVQVAAGAGATQEPYMRSAPVNPRNGLSTVTADANPTAAAAAGDAVALGTGWFYDPTTGAFAAAGFDETTNAWVEP